MKIPGGTPHLPFGRMVVPSVSIFAGSNQKFLNRQINIMSESFLKERIRQL
ncbi:MAG: hypothetical protein ABR911_03880 [Syntrophales bacterium]